MTASCATHIANLEIYPLVDGGADDVATSLGVSVEDPLALLRGCADAALLTEGHRAENSLDTRSPVRPRSW